MAVTPNSIITPQTPLSGKAKLTTQNTSYDVPNAAVQVLAGQPNGARLTRVQAIMAATSVAGDVSIYGYDGTNYRLIKAMPIAAQTIGAGGNIAAITPIDFGYTDAAPLLLGVNEQLMAALSVAQTSVHVRCEGAAY